MSLSTHTPSWFGLASHRVWLERETARLLDFARGSRVRGGFGWLDADGVPDPGQPLQLWITTRMTHVFALGHLLACEKGKVGERYILGGENISLKKLLAIVGVIDTVIAGVMVTCADADFVESAADVAVTVTVAGVGTDAGAM